MNQGFRQRVVGTLVLLALAVILAPVLFDFSDRPSMDESSQVPPAPAIDPVVFPEPQRPDDIPERSERELFWPEEAVLEADVSAEEPVVVAAPSTESPATASSSGAPQDTPRAEDIPADAWVIQVGSFGERAGAEALLQKLIDDGYKAYRRTQQRNGRELHQIFVGPVLSRAEADRQQAAIERQYSLQVLVRRFSP